MLSVGATAAFDLAQNETVYAPLSTTVFSLAVLSKLPVLSDALPPAGTVNRSDCVPQVAQRSVVSEVRVAPPLNEGAARSPLAPACQTLAGVG